MNETCLTDHLMGIASNPDLRQVIYEHMGEYCHQCRNRLNSLKLCLYLAKRQAQSACPSVLASLEQRYAALERSIDLIQTLCRPMAVSLSLLGLDLLIQDRLPHWQRLAVDRDVEIACVPPEVRAMARFDPDRMGQALDCLVDWRIAQLEPGSTARMTWRVDRGEARMIWEEEANSFGDPVGPTDPTHSWALPLITRVVEAHGGDVRLGEPTSRTVEIAWPIGPKPANPTTT